MIEMGAVEKVLFYVPLHNKRAAIWALAWKKSKQFFVVLVYLFLICKESGELAAAVRDVFFLTPAEVQYKVKKEELAMGKEQQYTSTCVDGNISTHNKELLDRPASY